MIKNLFHVLNKPIYQIKISSFPSLILSYHFSQSPPYQSLKSSQFAKQIGLEQQYRQVIKLQKQSQSSKFNTSAIMFGLVFLACGTVAIVSLIDENRSKLIKYRLNKWIAEMGLGEKIEEDKIEKEHSQNLKDMFEKNYKDRSEVDTKFLQHVGQYIDERINQVKKNKQKQPKNSLKLTNDIVYIIESLIEKFQAASQQKSAKSKHYVLQIVDKMIYFEITHQTSDPKTADSLNKPGKSSPKQTKTPELNFSQKLSKFMLMKGNLNQQLLGLKFLQSKCLNNQKPFMISSYFSPKQIDQIRSQILHNRSLYEKSLTVPSPSFSAQTQDQQKDLSRKILKVKEQLLYSMDELKQVSDIKKAKLDYLQEIFRQEKGGLKKKK